MQALTNIKSRAVPLNLQNIDTDQIIPARFLKAISREGFGQNLFRDWRFDGQNQLKKDFVLNDSNYSGQILIAGNNFGCGSSREHAAWALSDYGFKVVISSYFADIFKTNALNNGLVPIMVTPEVLNYIFNYIDLNPQAELTIDIKDQSLELGQKKVFFELDPYKKICLLNGYDDIDYLVSKKHLIQDFEAKRKDQ